VSPLIFGFRSAAPMPPRCPLRVAPSAIPPATPASAALLGRHLRLAGHLADGLASRLPRAADGTARRLAAGLDSFVELALVDFDLRNELGRAAVELFSSEP
jgi:hypothetical protein